MRPKESEVYKRIRLLGQGSFGKAYLCECLKDRSLCVIKQMDMRYVSEEEKKETYQEFRIMSHLKHPNIINFREVYKTVKGKLCIVMDYAEGILRIDLGGDLGQLIKNTEGYFAESKILDWFTQICLAVKHCHDRKIIHRDIKTQNMFLSKDMRIRLGDFGIARLLDNTRDKAHTMVGTPYYLAPELLENKPYSFKGDVWSLGVVLYEVFKLVIRCVPKHHHSMQTLLHRQPLKQSEANIRLYQIIILCNQERSLVNQLLTVNPEKRPPVHQILKMPIITNRIKNFLSETMKRSEFDHTILHNQQIHLSDVTIPLIDDQEIKEGESTPKSKKQQLPGIKSPPMYNIKQRKNSDLKKLPEIKIAKPDKPPITRQLTSRQQLQSIPTTRIQPSTPEIGNINKQKNGRFITKESPDSFQGSDQVMEEQTKNSEQGSPKFFQQASKPHIKNIKGLSKLDQIQSKQGQKSADEAKKKYRVHAQPKLLEQFIRKQRERKISEEIITTQQKQDEQQLEKISETPEQKLLDRTTISDFMNSEENQQLNKQTVETAAFNPSPSPPIILEATQKKVILKASKTDEEKNNKKKIYKIIYKDPFQKKPAVRKRNSEEDMKDMIEELKNVLQPEIHENHHTEQDNDSDASRVYSEDSSDDVREDIESIPPQTQVNTWMQANCEVNTSKSQPEPKREKSKQTLKDQLVYKLGLYFDQLFKLARLCSNQEDLGKQHIAVTLREKLYMDEASADLYATLLVTLATRGY